MDVLTRLLTCRKLWFGSSFGFLRGGFFLGGTTAFLCTLPLRLAIEAEVVHFVREGVDGATGSGRHGVRLK